MSAVTGEELLRAGRLAEARAAFAREAEVAERSGDDEALARAALGAGGLWVHDQRSQLDRARVADLRLRAVRRLDPASPLAHRLELRHRAEELYGTASPDDVEQLLEGARHHSEPVLLAEALHLAYLCLLGPRHLRRRRELAEELVAVSVVTGDPLHGLLGLADRALVLHELGDHAAGRALHELRDALAQTPCAAVEYALAVLDVMHTIGEGQLDEAEEEAARAHQLGLEVGDADADTWYAAQVLAVLWLRGDVGRMLALSAEFVDSVEVAEPAQIVFDAALAAAAAEHGDHAAARTALARIGVGRAAPQQSTSWIAAIFAVAEAAWVLGDVDAAALVLDALGPHPHLPVVVSRGVVSFGSTSRALGSAAAVLGRLDDAVDHLTGALGDDLATGTPVCRPHTLWRLAEVLDRRNGPDDAARAAAHRAEALEGALRFGLHQRAARWSRATSPPQVRVTAVGRTWEIAVGARRTTVPASVGMGYLAELVANPGVEVAALDLVAGQAVRAPRGSEVLDEAAVRAYRARVTALEEQADHADRTGDRAGSERARAELDLIVRELSAATGLGGRSRTFTDEQERARVSVHKAIQRALRAITQVDGDIGAALTARVTTGTYCRFSP